MREISRELPLAAEELHKQRDSFAEELQSQESWVVRVINPNHEIVFQSDRLAAEFPIHAFPTVGTGPVDRRGTNGARFSLAAESIDGWVYQFALDHSLEADFFRKVNQALVIAVLPTLAIGLGIGYLLARIGLRPINRIAREMQGLSTDRLDARVTGDHLPLELRDLTDSLNIVLERLQEAFNRLDQFSADVAHELRTPVHNIRQVAEIGLATTGEAANDRQTLGRVLDESDRLTRLIERLLLFARLSDPRTGLALASVRVADELAAVADFFDPVATEAGVSLVVAAPMDLVFHLDNGLFQRAISNLVANALAHTPAGGEVRLFAGLDTDGLQVEIRDNGIGIAQEALPHLFDRFYRTTSAIATGRGVGLGLAIVRRAVELHGGTVTIESQLGSGTLVRLFFPNRDEHDKDVIGLPQS
jgi:two-component system heavy metal sensor histidine kinase CusS